MLTTIFQQAETRNVCVRVEIHARTDLRYIGVFEITLPVRSTLYNLASNILFDRQPHRQTLHPVVGVTHQYSLKHVRYIKRTRCRHRCRVSASRWSKDGERGGVWMFIAGPSSGPASFGSVHGQHRLSSYSLMRHDHRTHCNC